MDYEVKWSEVAQLCPTLCDPMDCSLLHSSVHEIFQARVLEWVAISYSRGSSWPRDQTQVSCIVSRFFTIWATREAQCLLGGMLSPLCVTPSVARNDHILKYDVPLGKVALGKSAVSALPCRKLNLASYQEDRIPFSPLLRLEAFIAEGQRWIIFILTVIRKNA